MRIRGQARRLARFFGCYSFDRIENLPQCCLCCDFLRLEPVHGSSAKSAGVEISTIGSALVRDYQVTRPTRQLA